ncbi:MAG: nuclear transport factor 2 family protein [Rhodospirillaceae bacterium]|nr:nuclear transport factor 2 family protein [Rhodospirillaceae bacterium]
MDHAALMRSYFAAYNSEDEEHLAPLLANDVILVSAAGEQRGREAYLATYRWMIAHFIDRMTPEHIVADAEGALVDIDDKLTARADIADFLGRPVQAGQALTLTLKGRYTIQNGCISRIEIRPRASKIGLV